ncbi:tail assembly chaperone [Staphylococcus delphini]|uniref:tail assembly chaperone n=1 Tax=Staphylococcus TaxID=1279 RepID=UPI0021D08A51|nr:MULTISPECIES: tail assembly chaperone [Staphylococcus]UXR87133.1 tail assembly chaperone [Staphylococcus felis]UXS43739.1 tail assembly chaperone [Staphylococcus delphini]UXV46340.1 tail assembly chaperone [Staphylococcus delphini]
MTKNNVFQAEKFEPITELEFKDAKLKAKGTFMFDIQAEKYAKEDKDGNVSSGYHEILQGILNRKTIAIVQFWDCALAHLKQRPTKEEIQEVIQDVIEKEGTTLGLLQGAIQVLGESGFFKEEFKMFWFQMSQGSKMVKQEEKEGAANAAKYMKETYVTLTGKEPY